MAARKNQAVQAQQDLEAAAKAEQQLERIRRYNEEQEKARHEKWVAAGRPSAAESRAKMRALTAIPKPTALAHWYKVLESTEATAMEKDIARRAIARLEGEVEERVPGGDDE